MNLLRICLVALVGILPSVGATADPSPYFEVQAFANLSGRLAFGTTINGQEQIMVLDLDARRVRPLIPNPSHSPAFSPQGDYIAYISSKDGFPALYVATWAGESPLRLTNDDITPSAPAWTPDGDQIVFSASTKKRSSVTNIYTISRNGGSLAPVTQFDGANLNPSWSRDNKVVAYQTDRFWPGSDICAWNLLQRTENCLLTGSKAFARPTWSNSGKVLAFTTGSLEPNELGILKLESARRSPLATTLRKIRDISWSPDDRYLAVTAEGPNRDTFNLFAVDLDDRAFPMVRSTYSIRGISWSGVKTISLEAKRVKKLEPAEPALRPQATLDPLPEVQTPPPLLRELLGRDDEKQQELKSEG